MTFRSEPFAFAKPLNATWKARGPRPRPRPTYRSGSDPGGGASEVGNKISQHTDKAILAEQIDYLYQFTSDWVYCADMKNGTNCGVQERR